MKIVKDMVLNISGIFITLLAFRQFGHTGMIIPIFTWYMLSTAVILLARALGKK